jgi:hypothetical protein
MATGSPGWSQFPFVSAETSIPPTFRERYCRQCDLRPDEFEEHLFRRALYPHARLLRPVLELMDGFFGPDREFLRGVGDLRSRRLFHGEAAEYHAQSDRRRVLRRWLRLRVSAERTRVLMEACWSGRDSRPPQAG